MKALRFNIFFVLLMAPVAYSQATFNVQSSGRGLENAKMGARMQQLHDNQQAVLDALEPQSFANLPDCDAAGEKINWNAGTSTFTCIQEDDPTVSSFAKDPLPTCAGTEFLQGDGTDMTCVDATAVVTGSEIDPTVEDFAKDTLPTCGANEALKGNGTVLSCVAISGAGVESDPTVYSFAQNPLPTCGVGQVLKANGTVLSCVADTSGGFTESDPLTMTFAKGVMPVCAADEVLSNTDGLGQAFACVDAATAAAGAADDLGNHTATEALKMATFAIQNMADPTNAQDAATKNYVDTEVAAGVASVSETDPTVEDFAKSSLPNCTATQVLSGDGSDITCVDAATAAAGAADNLGNHVATQALNMSGYNIGSAARIGVGPDFANSGFIVNRLGGVGLTGSTTREGTPEFYVNEAGDTYLGANGSGLINMGSNRVQAVADPTSNQDAATKKYVDDQLAGGSGDSGTLDGLDSTQFLRSDQDDSTTGNLGVGDADIDGALTITGGTNINSVNTAGQGGIVIQGAAADASGFKLRLDSDEIQGSNNGSASALYLNRFGGNVIIGSALPSVLDMSGNRIVDVTDPSNAQDAATKKYVDDTVASGGADDLGNHTATQNLDMDGNHILDIASVRVDYDRDGDHGLLTEHDGGAGSDGIGLTGNAARIANPEFAVTHTGDILLGNGVSSTITFGGNRLRDIAEPVAADDAASKNYVDTAVASGGADDLGDHTATQNVTLGSYYLSGDGDDEGLQINTAGDLVLNGKTLHRNSDISVGPDISFAGGGLLASEGSFLVSIDSDNDSTDVDFVIQKDGNTNAATNLFIVDESGQVSVTGKIVGVTDPTNNQDAATKKYVDDQIASGGADDLGDHTATTSLDMASNTIVNVATPVNTEDAANKAYVDSAVASGGADDLGNHTATQNLDMDGNHILDIASVRVDYDRDGDHGLLTEHDGGAGSDGIGLTGNAARIANPEFAVTHAGDILLGNGVSSTITFGGNRLRDIAEPVAADDAASKNYVDTAVASGGADDLGDHTATQNIQTSGNWISSDGDDEGIYIDAAGRVFLEGGGSAGYWTAATVRNGATVVAEGTGPALGFGLGGSQTLGTLGFMFEDSHNDDTTFVVENNLADVRTRALTILATGYTGVGGIETPSSTLHVAGDIQIGNDSAACAATTAGAIRYNAGDVEFCNGTAWASVGGSGADDLGDHTATQNVELGSNWLSADGTNSGISYNTSSTMNVELHDATRAYMYLRNPEDGDFQIRYQNATNATLTSVNFNQHGSIFVASDKLIDISADHKISLIPGAGYNVGIDTKEPSSTLHVAGDIQIGNDAATCDGDRAGAIRYNAGDVEFCNGTAWASIAAGGADDLGNHTATQNVVLGANYINGDSSNEGIQVANNGGVTITTGIQTSGLSLENGYIRIDANENSDYGFISQYDGNGIGLSGSGSGINAPDLYVSQNGDVGVGGISGTDISAELEVSGTIIIADGGQACDAARAGGMRYNGGSIEFCNGTAWAGLGGGDDLGNHTATATIQLGNNLISNDGGVDEGLSFDPNGRATIAFYADPADGPEGLMLSSLTGSDGTIPSLRFGQGWNDLGVVSAIKDGFYDGKHNSHMRIQNTSDNSIWLDANGNVGVGTEAPSSTLHVSGTIIIADGGEACAAGTAGGMRYNGGAVEFCNGTAWAGLGGGASVAGSDGQIQFNDGGAMGASVNLTHSATNGLIASGTSAGVRGDTASTSGSGVYGLATSATGTSYGVRGRADSTSGRAIHGQATAATGVTYGVSGQSGSASGYGVYATNTNSGISLGIGAGDVDLNSNKIINLTDPTADQEAATKKYVDDQVAAGGDDLGDHTATQNITLGTNYLSGDGNDEGIAISSFGGVTISSTNPFMPGLLVYSETEDAIFRLQTDDSAEFKKILFNSPGGYWGINAWSDDAGGDFSINSSTQGAVIHAETTGEVGIGTSSPSSTLHVSGTIIIADGGEACAAGIAGGMRYNGGAVEFCNGTAWASIAAGGADDLGDHTATQNITLGTNYLSGDGNDEGIAISSTGGVTISATSPFLPALTVHSDTQDARLRLSTASASEYQMLQFSSPAGLWNVSSLADSAGHGFDIAYNSASIIHAETGGNVGIGTSAPSETLHLSDAAATIAINAESGAGKILFQEAGSDRWSIVQDTVNGLSFDWEGTSAMFFEGTGNSREIGIGTNSPSSTLHVAGDIQIGNDSATCAATTAGAIRYNSPNVEFCNGTAWAAFAAGGGASAINGLSDAIYDGSSVFLGNGSGVSDDGANANVAVGKNAMASITSGQDNTAVGESAMNGNASGYGNTAIGRSAMLSGSGASNVAIGVSSLRSNNIGWNNVSVGSYSMEKNNNGQQNVAMGAAAMWGNENGNQNVAVGSDALNINLNGNRNTALGFSAGKGNTSVGDDNVFIGHEAGLNVTGGARNTLIGSGAGDSITGGNDNILIGYDVDLPTVTTSNYMNIGSVIYGDLSSGNVGIGTEAPEVGFHVSYDGTGVPVLADKYGTASSVRLRGARGTKAAPTAILAGNNFGNFSALGYGSTGFHANASTSIKSVAVENFTDATQAADLTFSTSGSGELSTTERMRITSIGQVAIGTTSPSSTLHVVSGGSGITIHGDATATSGSTRGVYGQAVSPDGISVYGYNYAASGGAVGVMGHSSVSANGIGVYGYVDHATGENYGVFGESASSGGYGVYASNSNGGTSLKIASGNVEIGANYISNDGDDEGLSIAASGNATFSNNVTAVAFNSSSDKRLKDDIRTVLNPLEIIRKLRGVFYKWKDSGKDSAGVIAQEVQEVMPHAVVERENGMLAVEYNQLIAPMIEAIKMQQDQIEALQSEVETLKEQVNAK